MGVFDHFPYTNFHELNLDWILMMLKKINTTMEEFVAINTLKYADPIQWNITSQYEKNTIVIDPVSGTAYISVQPVPQGVLLTNTDYWTVVFDLESFVTKANMNFTLNIEAQTTLNATFASDANDWLIWNDILYKANVNIIPGDQYVEGSNITRITIEDITGHPEELLTLVKTNLVEAINELVTNMGDLSTLSTSDKTSIVNAINELVTNIGDLSTLPTADKTSIVNAIIEIVNSIGDLSNLLTSDQTSLVNAINELVTNMGDLSLLPTIDKSSIVNSIIEFYNAITADIGDLSNLLTSDQTSLVNAINELVGIIGDLTQLHTTDKSSIVNAINEVDDLVTGYIAGKNIIVVDTAYLDISGSSADVGDLIQTKGFYTADDGGAATYIVESSGTADNIITFSMSDGHFAKLMSNDPLNAVQIGMLNDGSLDISTIFNTVNATHSIYFPVGKYLVENTLNVQRSIYGKSRACEYPSLTDPHSCSVFVSDITGDNTTSVISITGTAVRIEGFMIRCHSEETGIYVNGNNEQVIDNVVVYECNGYAFHNYQAGTRPYQLHNFYFEMTFGHIDSSSYPNTIGIYNERGTDYLITNGRIMGEHIGFDLAGCGFISNVHAWGGGDTTEDWSNWNSSKGLKTREGATILATNLYLDTFAYPIDNNINSQIWISNLFIYSDMPENQTGVTGNKYLNTTAGVLHINGGYCYVPKIADNLTVNLRNATDFYISIPDSVLNPTLQYSVGSNPYLFYSDCKQYIRTETGMTVGNYYDIARIPYQNLQPCRFLVQDNNNNIVEIFAGQSQKSIVNIKGNRKYYYKVVGQFIIFYTQAVSTSETWRVTEIEAPYNSVVDYGKMLKLNRRPFDMYDYPSDGTGMTELKPFEPANAITATNGTIGTGSYVQEINGIAIFNILITATSNIAAFSEICTLAAWCRPSKDCFFERNGHRFFITASTGVISANYAFNSGSTIVMDGCFTK